MKIEPATVSNLTRITHWITSEKSCQRWAGPAVSYPIDINVLIQEISYRESNSYVGRVGGDIVGFGQLIEKSAKTFHIARVIVDPEKRGAGFGHQLVGALINRAGNASVLTLNVYRANQVAVALYQAAGFIEDKSRSTEENIFMVRHP